MKKTVPYLYFIVLFVITLVLFSFSLNRNENRVIKEIKVEFKGGKNYFLTHEMVSNELVQNGTTVLNQQKGSIDLFNLETLLSHDPYVEEADISISPKGIMKTYIKQRVPIARIIGLNENYYIDKELVKMPISSNFSARVPLVKGVYKKEDIKKIQQLMFYIHKDKFLMEEIIAVEKKGKNFILLVRSGDYIINFGDVNKIDKKFRNLKAFYSKAFADKSIEKYKEINIKFSNQVVCIKK